MGFKCEFILIINSGDRMSVPNDDYEAFRFAVGALATLEDYLPAAAKGDTEAQFNAAECYRLNQKIDPHLVPPTAVKRLEEAIGWYTKAINSKKDFAEAIQGLSEAEFDLGELYRTGTEGALKDVKIAFEYHKTSANHGLAKAMCSLGIFYSEGEGIKRTADNKKEAFEWFKKAEKAGYAGRRLHYALGRCYHHGDGVQKDLDEAFRYYHLAAVAGDAESQCIIGELQLIFHDIKCLKELGNLSRAMLNKEAMTWFQRAADQNYPRAKYALGCRYRWLENHDLAFKLFTEALNQGYLHSYCPLGFYYEEGVVVPKDSRLAFQYFELAQKNNLLSGSDYYEMAMLYFSKDPSAARADTAQVRKAKEWLIKSVCAGYDPAIREYYKRFKNEKEGLEGLTALVKSDLEKTEGALTVHNYIGTSFARTILFAPYYREQAHLIRSIALEISNKNDSEREILPEILNPFQIITQNASHIQEFELGIEDNQTLPLPPHFYRFFQNSAPSFSLILKGSNTRDVFSALPLTRIKATLLRLELRGVMLQGPSLNLFSDFLNRNESLRELNLFGIRGEAIAALGKLLLENTSIIRLNFKVFMEEYRFFLAALQRHAFEALGITILHPENDFSGKSRAAEIMAAVYQQKSLTSLLYNDSDADLALLVNHRIPSLKKVSMRFGTLQSLERLFECPSSLSSLTFDETCPRGLHRREDNRCGFKLSEILKNRQVRQQLRYLAMPRFEMPFEKLAQIGKALKGNKNLTELFLSAASCDSFEWGNSVLPSLERNKRLLFNWEMASVILAFMRANRGSKLLTSVFPLLDRIHRFSGEDSYPSSFYETPLKERIDPSAFLKTQFALHCLDAPPPIAASRKRKSPLATSLPSPL